MSRYNNIKPGIRPEYIIKKLVSPEEFQICCNIQAINGLKGIPSDNGIYFRFGKKEEDVILLRRKPGTQEPESFDFLVSLKPDLQERVESIAKKLKLPVKKPDKPPITDE